MSREFVTHEESNSSLNEGYSPYIVWLVWIVWLPFIAPPIVQLFQSHSSLPILVIMLICSVLFIATYTWATLQNARVLVALEPENVANPKWLAILLLLAFSLTIILLGAGKGYGNAWFGTLIFTSAYVAGRLPTFQAFISDILLTLLTITLGIFIHLSSFETGQSTVFVFVVGIVTMSVVRAVVTGQKLRAAREEIAHLAVTNERLRIARDLHDLLGHNLSIIALKSELAGRLISVAPERAANEIRDVESVARTTLQEVREAVAAYRQPTLVNELHAAQEILAVANITYHFEGDETALESLPTTIDAMLAWMVREGVTNVVKHSRAHQCTVRFTKNVKRVSIEIIDDGTTFDAHAPVTGNGLRGLSERVTALDGHYESGSLVQGGFRLFASVPLIQKRQETDYENRSLERS
ncbi:MAG TPA: hypothetical protein DHW02_12465 [Ktedonobacter sp.]|nr:hypothetical protein [Ktedonobacter sp.]